ncbi:MAG: DNA polymerase III subunit alpha [Candidatus Ryanbacteria bacterium RIFCSPLOWO2_02_FULL_47_14]|uniref:DNA polymerase III subunit alpha n=1 Tax=Candidatus Ryanbacteria bacterium RIFCSPLOWO2_02_FULL_47_14 TaxID=1802129 RepID=A0A1G2GXR4_9BACT|nr:MAG: polymerase III catalytic subunit, DnaE type protein [Parcubacteria group bacterium GW2011_GWA1_47_9]OGZ55007.1 MAG: DNA polymerase III subunit alpha [Candidatus Ryanbacteria bacterium RIFCSPLOWO2_02_FULL_47_14]
MKFVHLHTHSHYSLLDGLSKIDALVDKAHEYDMPALALTDHGNLYGAIEFYQKCKKADIKPILGIETYIAKRSLAEKVSGVDHKRYHLTVLATSMEGWKNLIKLATIANLEGFYYKPRVDKETLRKHAGGLIALSGCMGGEIPQALLSGEQERAEDLLKEYREIFGTENFFIELSYHPGIPNHENLQNLLRQLAEKTGTPVVATQDIHYTNSEDAPAQDVLLAVQTNSRLDDDDRLTMKNDDFSFRSGEEMARLFEDLPEAIENTVKIAERVNLEIPLGILQLPHFELPHGETAESFLSKLATKNLSQRYNPITKEIEDRLSYELGVIVKSGFAEYFLIVHDIVQWAKSRGIIVGPGRGSGVGSLVAYSLQITNVDPIRYNLLFERFMNPERISPPDFDLDFADTRRDEVLEYAAQKYGKDHVAQIITFGTMAARAAIRDAGRALGFPLALADQVAKLVPFNPNQGKKENYLRECIEHVVELKDLYARNPDVKKMVDAAEKLEGVVRHASTHACAVVITKEPLVTYVPLQRATERDGKSESLVTQFEMHAIEDLGLLKIDFLGLSNLSIIEETVKRIKKLHGKDIDIDTLEVDDPKVYKTLAIGKTIGVFQLEGTGMTRYLKELKPTNFEDIIAIISLYRPGALDAGTIPHYIARKNGREEVTYLHSKLEPVLKNTYGIMIYQEQLMQAAQALAGFTMPQADTLRKAVGKKIRKLLTEQKEKLISGIIKNTGSERVAQEFWKLVEPFGRYGFNRSHAAGYATIAYQTAWLKTYYPTEFMTSLLNAEEKNIERMTFLLGEAATENITILPPDVNESRARFAVSSEKTIRFGLAAIKNVGINIVRALVEERDKNGPYTSLANLLERVSVKDLNKKSIEALARSGAFDQLAERNEILENIEKILGYLREANSQSKDQHSLFGLIEDISSVPQLTLEKRPPASQDQKLTWEKELLGFYISGHPLDKFKKLAAETKPIKLLKERHSSSSVKVLCMLTAIRRILTRRGEPMVFLKLQDTTDEIEGVAFPSTLKMYGHMLEADKYYLVEGRVSDRNGVPSMVCNTFELLEYS